MCVSVGVLVCVSVGVLVILSMCMYMRMQVEAMPASYMTPCMALYDT
jgi:hypothetical protein